jgi:hypothetical protein
MFHSRVGYPQKTRLDRKSLPDRDTLAYYEHWLIAAVKSFITLGPGVIILSVMFLIVMLSVMFLIGMLSTVMLNVVAPIIVCKGLMKHLGTDKNIFHG